MKTLLALLLTGLSIAAQGQTPSVWRCGPDGRSYSDSPCPAGREVRVDDSRDTGQVQAAREIARRDQMMAQALVREREQRERAWAGPTLAGIKPTAQPGPPARQEAQRPPQRTKPKATGSRKPKPDAAADTWTSTAPGSRHKPG